VWVGLVYSALYLLVEHRRAAPSRFSFWDDLLYLTALPRLVMPFFQPISPASVKSTAGDMDLRRFRRAVGLGLYGAGLLVFVGLSRGMRRFDDVNLQAAREFPVYYAAAAGHIFVAVAAFRSLGMDLPSGFRWPFLSRSFAEFFRRWNHYVRDAVLSLFYFPLIGTLRRWLPRRAAEVLAPYLAIFLGSFVLNDALAPVVTSADPLGALRRVASPLHLGALFVYWSAIVLPRTLWHRGRTLPQSGWRRWLATAIFLLLYSLLWRVIYATRSW
jgi:hypothetical protein